MDPVKTALEFLNYTGQSVFLTGKAGTGKTTFLRNLIETCSKSFIVVAPTGVAALNAGGVTIHSQFLFPFGSFLPEGTAREYAHLKFYDRRDLNSRHPLNAVRRKVLQGIDLMVIDEVSMCRADLLDAIDQRLRTARRNKRPFGGVQLLMIGDLYQLPPIVSEEEWMILKDYYASPHFFSSKALKQTGFAKIELEKVYRQEDDSFVQLLNKIRHSSLDDQELLTLNQRYKEDIPDDVIHLVTHRNQAAKINRDRLDSISAEGFSYEAKIRGDFPDRLYPMDSVLELKQGSKVMFIRNDSEEGLYYNGKIAEVVELDSDGIWVDMEDEVHYKVPLVTWKNTRYNLNGESQELEEELLGEFSHYPLRLAWAITIHKSQGLSFDRAVVDLGRAFAPGQAYVALTRLRSIDGLFLSAPLRLEALITDSEARSFSRLSQAEDVLDQLSSAKRNYQEEYFLDMFDWQVWHQSFTAFWQKYYEKLRFDELPLKDRFTSIEQGIQSNSTHAAKFRFQLGKLIRSNQQETLLERLHKAQEYFTPRLKSILAELQALKLAYSQLSRTKQLVESMEVPISQGLSIFLKLTLVQEAFDFFNHQGKSPFAQIADQKDRCWKEILNELPEIALPLKLKGRKSQKGETYKLTYRKVKEGISLSEIAEERGLTIGTIYRHYQKGIIEGKLVLDEVLEPDQIRTMQALLKTDSASGAYQWSQKYPEYHVEEWRILLTALRLKAEEGN